MSENTPSYTVLARRFRPQTFDEVVGQQPVAQALKNAISSGRVAHAYLFTGARGVGKTSMARILAKALNCPNVENGIPCNTCEICQGISAGSDVDIQEIDGASNRRIEDIRMLRAGVNVRSMRTQFKMYIIDEVHMLTNESFNALLKTLEEPPPNVKFVFCTTEPNKVPDTILSRCQRFDFSTIATANIAIRLQQIAEAEGYTVEEDALQLVARRACGSMRDSQSLFDQLLAFGESQISAADVHRLFGTADDELLVQLFDAILGHQQGAVLKQLDDAIAAGVQLSEFVDQLLAYLRDLMVITAGAHDVSLLSVSDSQRNALERHAGQWGLQTTVSALQILSDTKTRMGRTTMGRVFVELAMVRLCLLEELTTLTDLVTNWQTISTQTTIPQSVTAIPAPQAVPNAAPVEATSTTVETPMPEPAAVQNGSPDATVSDHQRPDSAEAKKQAVSPVEPTVRPLESTSAGNSATPVVSFERGNEKALWAQVVSQIDDVLKTHLVKVSDVAISAPNQLQLTYPAGSEFNKKYCEQPKVLGELEKQVKLATGQAVRINIVVAEKSAAKQLESEQARTSQSPANKAVIKAPHDPFVETVNRIFGSTIVKSEPLNS